MAAKTQESSFSAVLDLGPRYLKFLVQVEGLEGIFLNASKKIGIAIKT